MNERCFAMRRGGQCGALTCRCPGYATCVFYKPRWKQEKELNILKHRLIRLPAETQSAIAEKYFRGAMPWKEDAQ